MTRPITGVYAILDTQILRGRDPGDLAAATARGGASIIQLRAKDATTREWMVLANRTMAGLAASKVPLLINDRIDVALAVGAAGVHIGRDDMDPVTARRLLGPNRIIGVTLKNAADVEAVAQAPVDYGCIGGVYATRHKKNPDAPVGLDGFATLRQLARKHCPGMSVGAIAGITEATAASLANAGADFIAVVGAVFDAPDVAAATRAIGAAFGERGRA